MVPAKKIFKTDNKNTLDSIIFFKSGKYFLSGEIKQFIIKYLNRFQLKELKIKINKMIKSRTPFRRTLFGQGLIHKMV